MSPDESIDKEVDKLLDRFSKKNKPNTNVKDETKPFRYITDEDEIKSVLKSEETPTSIADLPEEAKKVGEKDIQSGLGDTDAIDRVLKRHIETRKFNDK